MKPCSIFRRPAISVLFLAGAALLLSWGLPPASAQSSSAKAVLQALDANGDSLVLEDEFVDGIKKLAFANMDQDSDGKITAAEWNAAEGGAQSAAVFKRMDLTKDGSLEELEFIHDVNSRNALAGVFRTLDKNGANALIPSHFE